MGLLEKVKIITNYIRENIGKVKLKDLSPVLATLMTANVIALNSKNEIVAKAYVNQQDSELLDKELDSNSIFLENRYYFNTTMGVTIKEFDESECTLSSDDCSNTAVSIMTIPLVNKRNEVIRIVLIRLNNRFAEVDQILGEVLCSILTMELLYREVEYKEKELRKNVMVEIALDALSYSEVEAARNIFHELGNTEGFLVASKVADKVGITRSVIVNALRKLESAGVIESRSLGMKGTYIKVLNDRLLEQLNIEK